MRYTRRRRLGTRPGLVFLKIPGGRVQFDGGLGIHEMPDSNKLEKDEQPLRLFVFVAEGMMT